MMLLVAYAYGPAKVPIVIVRRCHHAACDEVLAAAAVDVRGGLEVARRGVCTADAHVDTPPEHSGGRVEVERSWQGECGAGASLRVHSTASVVGAVSRAVTRLARGVRQQLHVE